MHKIWSVLSFRQRPLLPIAAMILSALMSGAVALLVFSPDQFEYENEQEAGSARAVANALNAALKAPRNPEEMLDAFGTNLGNVEAVGYLPGGTAAPKRTARFNGSKVPAWFVSNLAISDLAKSYPIDIGTVRVGAIAYSPDLSADIWEKWMGFLAIISTGSLPMLFATFGTHLVAGRTIRPMERLGAGLTRMREGDYDAVIPLTGPPEIQQFCREANRLAAIRANVAALSESAPESSAPLQGLVEAAEALQQANKRILQGLSPLYLEELGLFGSLEALLRDARGGEPSDLGDFTLRIDGAGRIIRVGEQKDARAVLERGSELRKIETGFNRAAEIVHRHRHRIASEEFDKFPVGEIVRLNDRDPVACSDATARNSAPCVPGVTIVPSSAETGAPVNAASASDSSARMSAEPRYSV